MAVLLLLFLLPLIFASPARSFPSDGVVGVSYTMSTPGLPPPEQVADALVAAGVPRVLLIDPYPDGVAAFSNTGIPLTIALNNTFIPPLASKNPHAILSIVHNFLLVPNITVECVTVGYGILTDHLHDLADDLLPALQNLRAALSKAGIGHSATPISTANNYELITPGFPPSEARFNESVVETYVKPLLGFLNRTNSPLLIDAYPFRLYRSGAKTLPNAGLATFDNDASDVGNFLQDPNTGLFYSNLFDAMVDAVVTGMGKLGYDDVPMVVAGTGWPSSGRMDEPQASVLFAGEYNERLVARLNTGKGTPLRPGVTPVTYIYGLFDDPRNAGDELEGNWGIWTPDLAPKYVINFTPSENGAGRRRRHRVESLLLYAGVLLLILL